LEKVGSVPGRGLGNGEGEGLGSWEGNGKFGEIGREEESGGDVGLREGWMRDGGACGSGFVKDLFE
jgi:hypothetical protein